MFDKISISNMLNSIVPISRFNRGEAGKIFEEVNSNGFKIVVKNNKPTCVLITPKKYEEMIETIENYYLFLEAEKRMANAGADDLIGHEQLKANLNIDSRELGNIKVEIE
jgi:antitoxin StbD